MAELVTHPLNGLSIDTSDDALRREQSFFKKAAKMLKSSVAQPVPPQSTLNWGSTITKTKFEDMEMLENGFAREYLTEECLSPTQNEKKWTNCFIERTEKTKFKLYMDVADRFLLSAKKVGDVFYISQYEDFPDLDDVEANYCAVLRKTPGQCNFKLYNCGCEGCDTSSNKYTCSHTHDVETVGADRQLLADISQFTKKIKHVDAAMRCMSLIIPAVMDDKRSRVVWCPRVSGEDTPRGSTPRSPRGKNFVTSPRPSPKRVKDFNEGEDVDDRSKFVTKLPEWNEELRSLVLKFHGGRVLAASSKNFLMTSKDDPEHGILQFGKARKGKFVLDFRYPIAPIQAFAIGLASCSWTAE